MTLIAVATALLLAAQPGVAHDPGTYGGPADRLCRPVLGQAISVGASFRRWRCPGTRKGSAFRHCHGRGRGAAPSSTGA